MTIFDLQKRVAFITGGNGGIGLGMAKGLASAGATVVIAGRNKTKAQSALAELRSRGAQADFVELDGRVAWIGDWVDGTTQTDRIGLLDCGGADNFYGVRLLSMERTQAYSSAQVGRAHQPDCLYERRAAIYGYAEH